MALDSPFKVVSVAHTYEVLDRRWTSIRTRHKFVLESLRPHRLFLREYTWDNELGIEKPPFLLSGRTQSGTASHRLQGPVIVSPGGKRIAVIDLGRTINPTEREVVEVEHFFVRVDPDPAGYVGEASKVGCEAIELTAIVPAHKDLRPHMRSKPLDSSEWGFHEALVPEQYDVGRVRLSYKIQHPTPGLRYRIGWDQPTQSHFKSLARKMSHNKEGRSR